MAKKKSPAPKRGGKKKCAPKKAVKRKPIPQQVTEKAVKERIGKTLFLGDQKLVDVPLGQGVVFDARDFDVVAIDSTERLTVEEQFDTNDRYRYATMEKDLPAPKPPGPGSKFWRQYQDESGKFIGWRKALTKTKDQVISRLVLRKKVGSSPSQAEASPDTTVRERV